MLNKIFILFLTFLTIPIFAYTDNNAHYSRREIDMIKRHNATTNFERAVILRHLNDALPGMRNQMDLARERNNPPNPNIIPVPATNEGYALEQRLRQLEDERNIARLKMEIAHRERDIADIQKWTPFIRQGSNIDQWGGHW